jgi:hypothetical protein
MRFLFLLLFLTFPLIAKSDVFFEDAGALGVMAGVAKACGENTQKLDDYELIAVRLIANKADSAIQEKEGYRKYVQEKMKAERKQKNAPAMSCGEVLSRFENMPLFESVVYRDGSLKLSDGTFLPAKRPPLKVNKK